MGQQPHPQRAGRLPGRLGVAELYRHAWRRLGRLHVRRLRSSHDGPEVHADGEIWVQTLWDLRKALGVRLSESLVTRAMELAPSNPSYLDMRNSILQADVVTNNGRKQTQIWTVFAHRGMGWFAAATGGDDTTPVEDFSMPPPANAPRGSLTGTVRQRHQCTNRRRCRRVRRPRVRLRRELRGDHRCAGRLHDHRDHRGHLREGLRSGGAGYEAQVQTLSIAARSNTANWTLRRDWAALGGGATVVDFNGDDATAFGCGPAVMFDQSQGSTWSTDAILVNPADQADVDPRFVTVKLPQAVDISDVQINPSGGCGDGLSASTGKYSVETSPDGVTWTQASTPGAAFDGSNRSKMNSIALQAGSTSDVQYLRFTMLGTQLHVSGGSCPGAFSACDFVDATELAVYGAPN